MRLTNDKYIFNADFSIQRDDYKIEKHHEKIYADTSKKQITIYLNDSPHINDIIKIYDLEMTWDTTNLIIDNNNHRILGRNEQLICDVKGAAIALIYKNDKIGWIVQ